VAKMSPGAVEDGLECSELNQFSFFTMK